MELNYYHKHSEVYCNHCGYDQFDIFNDNYCEFCMHDITIYFTCGLCLETYNIYENMEICQIYYDNANIIKKFLKKKILIKRLNKYIENLLESYYNPKSKYIEYIVNNFDNNKNIKQIGYINKYNNLRLFQIKKY
jgi:1-deoxy-D-xylulose 5-phosphate reductoisomerase